MKRFSILILLLTFSLHAYWMSAVLYLRHSTRLGSCYREYRGVVEFAFFDDQDRAVRRQIEGADLDSFSVLTKGVSDQECESADLYAKDKHQAYYRDEVILTSNLAGFRDIGTGYARDNLNVYYRGALVEGADAQSFVRLSHGYAKDRNLLFFEGASCDQPADIKTFRMIDEFAAGDAEQVYVIAKGVLTHIKGAQPDSFTLISSSDPQARLYRDDVNAFLVDMVFEDLERRFQIEQPVWYRIKNADPKTLRMIGGHYYTADANRVFYKGMQIEGADPAGFMVLMRPYARDRKSVFYENRIVSGAQAATFKPFKLDEAYSVSATDSKYVYYGSEVSTAVPVKYQQIDEFYAKDLAGVYYRTERVQGADAQTFEVIDASTYDARDAFTFYEKGHALGASNDEE